MFRTLIGRGIHVARVLHIALTIIDLQHALINAEGIMAVFTILELGQFLNIVFAVETTHLYFSKGRNWCAGILGKSKSDETK